MLPSLEVYS